MKRARENRMARDVMAPVVERHAPGIRVGITAEAGEPLRVRARTETSDELRARTGPYGVSTCVLMEDRFAEQQVAVRRADEIVQRVMRVLGAESGEEDAGAKSALPSPSVSLRNVRCGCSETYTPPSPSSN